MEKGAIQRCDFLKDQWVLPYFLVQKPDGTYRFILNLKQLNKFVYKQHFKLENLNTAVELIFPNYYLASVDLKDAYFLIPVHVDSRKYLRFIFNGQLYDSVCLPFGLFTAPYIFTKVMKVVVKQLRSWGFSSVIYLDDILCIEDSLEKCERNVNQTIKLLEYLGFKVNYKKSSLKPNQLCKFLGVSIDTREYAIKLPEEKKEKIIHLVDRFIELKHCTIQEFARLIGKLVSCCIAIEFGWLYTKQLEKEKIFQLIFNDYNYNRKMSIPNRVKEDLIWWKNNIKNRIHLIKSGYFEMTIFTDASTTGWGASNGLTQIYGFWSLTESKFHIEFLQLLTIKIALKELASDLRNVQILIKTDNTTALSYVNKMGGIRFEKFSKLSKKIWQWAEARGIILIASYIPSKNNIIADRLSRMKNIDTEWQLNDYHYELIFANFGTPSIDLFATAQNSKCKRFISWGPEKGATYVEAFTVNWSSFYFYAFPPFSLILKVLSKMKCDKAYGIIIIPFWKNQPWFPLFESLTVGKTMVFEPNPFLLISPCRSQTHPRSDHLRMIACRVSGNPF